MAVGDDALARGFPIVPDSGAEESKVGQGFNEINRTRDFAAQTKKAISEVWPISRGGTGANNRKDAKTNLGIHVSGSMPQAGSGTQDDIWLKPK